MLKIIFGMLFIFAGNELFAQHIHYFDDSKRERNDVQPAKPAKKDTAATYHQWADLCPGLPASTPVLLSYVPKELVLKLRETFKGHLYSISSYKVQQDTVNYKLKVCQNGEIKFEYADQAGNIIQN